MKKMFIIKSRTASHEVDPQKGFTPICPEELPVPNGDEIATELHQQAKFAKYRTVSKDVHPTNALWLANEVMPQLTPLNLVDEPNIDVAWNPHCISGTVGAELIPGLPKITEYDFIVFKGVEPNLHPYSGVYHDLKKRIPTGLAEYYRQKNISTVIVGGLALDFCVKETSIDLAKRGFVVIVNLAATRAIGDSKPAIDEMKNYGVIIVNSSEDFKLVEEPIIIE